MGMYSSSGERLDNIERKMKEYFEHLSKMNEHQMRQMESPSKSRKPILIIFIPQNTPEDEIHYLKEQIHNIGIPKDYYVIFQRGPGYTTEFKLLGMESLDGDLKDLLGKNLKDDPKYSEGAATPASRPSLNFNQKVIPLKDSNLEDL